jgi:hypothetical protein
VLENVSCDPDGLFDELAEFDPAELPAVFVAASDDADPPPLASDVDGLPAAELPNPIDVEKLKLVALPLRLKESTFNVVD